MNATGVFSLNAIEKGLCPPETHPRQFSSTVHQHSSLGVVRFTIQRRADPVQSWKLRKACTKRTKSLSQKTIQDTATHTGETCFPTFFERQDSFCHCLPTLRHLQTLIPYSSDKEAELRIQLRKHQKKCGSSVAESPTLVCYVKLHHCYVQPQHWYLYHGVDSKDRRR